MVNAKKYRLRYDIIRWFIILSGALLLFKAAELQLFNKTFRQRANAATISKQVLQPSRGLIYDRNGELLVYNDPIYDIEVTYRQIRPNMDTSLFCELLGISKTEFEERLDVDWSSSRYARHIPFVFLSKIRAEVATKFMEYQHEFPGFAPVLKNTRGYNTQHAAQVLGYMSEVDPEIIEKQGDIYERRDFIGSSGIEKAYEKELRGNKGLQYVLKDKWGRKVDVFDEGRLDTAAISGQDILISLDADLQAYAESLLKNKKGGIVAIEPSTGEILCMVSSPTYPPDDLKMDRNRSGAYRKLARDSLQPFFNRAISANYPPGSVMKPVYALAGQEMGLRTPGENFRCKGAYTYKSYSWGCHAGPGTHDMVDAIQKSCNSYFYDLYRKMVEKHGWASPEEGLFELNQLLRSAGLGQKLGVDIGGESPGLLPGPTFYTQRYALIQEAEWRSTYIISNGIGQGEVELTTLQIANLAAMIANRGSYYAPHLIKAFKNRDKPIPLQYRQLYHSGFEEAQFDPVIEGMERAVKYGTARRAYLPDLSICGKTGTSENPHGEDHSVFFAFAPKENPQIAIAAYVENGGYGSTYAAPICGLIIEKYLKGEISPSKKWEEERILNTNLIELP